MIYETNKSLNLEQGTLYYSKNKWFTQKKDSIVVNFKDAQGSPDSVVYESKWNIPVYLTLKLKFKERIIKSNTLYVLPGNSNFESTIGDAQFKIRSKLADSGGLGQGSILGVAIIIQTILEMIIAFLISRVFGYPRLVILMVLAANIAAFPFYLIQFPSMFLKEVGIFTVKAITMSIIGLRKVPKYKILLLLLAITFIGLGFKELFFFLARVF